MARGKHARKRSWTERAKRARPAGIAIGVTAIVLCGLTFAVLFTSAATPPVEAYQGTVTLANRALPQTAPLLAPSDYARDVLGLTTEDGDNESESEQYEEDPATASLTPPTVADLAALDNPPGVFTFCTSDADAAPQLTEPMLAALAEAAAPLAEQGDTVGYLFMDLATGAGVASNIDGMYYSASTIKGPFAVFVCQWLIDGARLTPSDTLAIGPVASLFEEGVPSSELAQLIDDAIRYSSNDAYLVLRENLTNEGWLEWLTALGLDPSHYKDRYYADYSVREAAILWLATYDYLQTATPTAQWLESLFADTDTSFIRRGLADADVTVENKAGWITEYPADAINDCGLIRTDETTYLMVLLSDGPEGEPTEGAVSALARALYETRTAFPTPR